VDADELVDFGAVVVVVVVVVLGVVVGVVAASEDEAPVDEAVELAAVDVVVAAVAGVVVAVVAVVATVDEWAVLPEATRTPRPTAPAEAARPMPTVARRTRVMARSRARTAEWGEGLCDEGCGAIPGLSVLGRCASAGHRWSGSR
jgi:ABC-type dipeptide/oligopeptide/nickel transport system permease subunit